MASRIEDYALIGDSYSAALVARDGSIDWLCLPRFDSGAVFAALLGTREHGRWLLAPCGEVRAVRRRYRADTLILETDFETADGAVRLIDCMPERTRAPDLVRVVEGLRGHVPMRLELLLRCDYGAIVPWVQAIEGGLWAIAGPDSFLFRTTVPLRWEHEACVADFQVAAGQRIGFTLTWHPSHESSPPLRDTDEALTATEGWWRAWSARCTYRGPWRDAVLRSLITLKALTYAPTGGIVAAATTSLPEQLGGVRNWDYRYCWLRDSTFTLLALLNAGYREEAQAWRQWLLRAVAGTPAATNIMYGLAGERRLPELELAWLPGYGGARPVRIGNAAARQFQLDIYGEVLDVMYHSRRFGLQPDEAGWRLEEALVAFVETAWERPDEGIWEVRGPRRHFTHSKVMAWVALDRAIKTVEHFQVDGPVERWRLLRDTIHQQICQQGFDAARHTFVQSYGAQELDASLLLLPLVGFLPATDPRVQGTVAAIERHLLRDGLVYRYTSAEAVDGLPPGEGAFLVCTCWLADTYMLLGRDQDARRLFERLLALRNDVGLLAEEYDPLAQRLVGNFPQALSHIGLVTTALNLSPQEPAPAEQRQQS
jgi:GH15 family glucan-1,4-alpha-glucosidase